MTGKTLRAALCGVLLLAVAGLPAEAGFYIGARGGMSNQNVSSGDIHFDKNSAFLCGVQAGFKFLGVAVEGEYYRAGHDLLSPDSRSAREMSYNYLGVNGKLGVSLVVLYPYLTVGYGIYSVDLHDLGKDSDRAFNIGAGAEVRLGKVGLFAELRYTDFSMEISNLEWDFGGVDFHAGFNVHL